MRTISIFLALLNSVFAGFLILLDLSYAGLPLDGLWWSLLKLSTASAVIVIGVSAWLAEMGALRLWSVLLGGLFLIALGPATLVWAVHVALTTGEIELHMAVFAVSLTAQGMASLLGNAAQSAGLAGV